MSKAVNKIRSSSGDRLYYTFNLIILVIIGLIVFYPIYFVIIASVSEPDAVNSGQVAFLPAGVTMEGYAKLLEDNRVWLGYRNTVLYTLSGTLLSVALTLLAAYPLSRLDLPGRRWLSWYFLFTMFFNGGLIPTFLTVKGLGLYDTPFVLVILGALSIYNLLVAKAFFQSSIPCELHDAAAIDGCGNLRFFASIVLPLSKALIGVLVVYYAVSRWNEYFNALIYTAKRDLQPLQMALREILIQNSSAQIAMDESMMQEILRRERYAELIKYGAIVFASLPVLLITPFVQKYFEKGVMLGAVKG